VNSCPSTAPQQLWRPIVCYWFCFAGKQEPTACDAVGLKDTGRGVAQQRASCLLLHERILPRPEAETPTSTQETSNIEQQDPAGRAFHLDKVHIHHPNGRQTITRSNGRAREHDWLIANNVHVRRLPRRTRRAPRPSRAHHKSLEGHHSFVQEDVRNL
jgi:hypothetical protein